MNPSSSPPPAKGSTPETRWSLVRCAGGDEEDAVRALDELLVAYLPVLRRTLITASNLDTHTREDLLQGFVARHILDKGLLKKADPGKGRFRNFLIRSFQNYVRDEIRKERTRRRSPGSGALLPLGEVEAALGLDDGLENAFHLAWTARIVQGACERLQTYCRETGQEDVWTVFQLRLKGPLLEGSEPLPYADLIEKIAVESPAQAANLLITAKRMLRRMLEEEIYETVADPDQAGEEWEVLRLGLKKKVSVAGFPDGPRR